MIKDILNAKKDYIIQEYNNGRSTCDLGRELGCSNASIFLFLRNSGVTLRVIKKFDQSKDDIKRLYDEGKPCKQIAEILGLPGTSVLRYVRKLKLDSSRYSFQREDPISNHVDEIKEMYASGIGSWTIAKKFNCADNAVRWLLEKHGVEIRELRQYELDETFFEKIDTEAKAYFFGWMCADGSIDERSVTISLTDLEPIDKFKRSIKYSGIIEIILPRNDRLKKQYRLRFSSIKIRDDLIALGCVHRKTYYLEFPTENQVPREFFWHFLRGFSDGDATITHSNGKNNWNWKFVATEMFCSGVSNYLFDTIGIQGSIFCPYKNCGVIRSLSISGKFQLKTFLDYLYKDSIIYLTRKYNKYQEFLQSLRDSNSNS